MDSGDQGLFWGVILKPEKRYEQVVEEDFRITKACVDPSTLDSGKVASVILEKDNDEFIICNLTSPTGLSEPMDLAFAVGEKVVFRTEGGATVHLTGHTQPADEMPGYPGFDEVDSDDEEEAEEEESSDAGEEEEEEEETPPQLVKKRKLELVNGNGSHSEEKSAKKQKKEAVKQAEAMKKILAKEKVKDEEDSDDDDQMEQDMEELEEDDDSEEGGEEEEDSEETEESSPEPVKKEATPKAKKEKKQKQQAEAPVKNGSGDAEKETPKKEAAKKTEKVKGEKEQQQQQTPAKTGSEPAETPKSKKKKNKFKEGGENGQEQQAKTPGKEQAKTPGKDQAKTTGKDQAKTPGKDQAKPPGKEDAGKTPKKTLKGGIQVEELRVGNGPEAKAGKMIGMYYDGKLTKGGKRFDACKQGKPFKFKLGRGEVIKGWDVGVEGMKVGGKRRLTIPAPMGYGSQGAPPDIPPNASLTFEVECKMVN